MNTVDPLLFREAMGHYPTGVAAVTAVLETAYAARWCAEAVELLQRNSGSTAILETEPIQRAWRDARVITLHGALNLEALSENYGRLMAGTEPHKVAGITALDRFAPPRSPRTPDPSTIRTLT